MKFPPAPRLSSRKGFTLVELLVSVAVLSVLMLMVFQMLDETQRTWSRAKGMVASFKDARDGFEAMNRNVSQATLNTYLGFEQASATNPVPTSFGRTSELHFICGPADKLMDKVEGRTRITHCIFFQAPLGYQTFEAKESSSSANGDPYIGLENLLNGWGYYVEYGSDKSERPPFLSELTPPVEERYRFRLMEFRQPAEVTTIYQYRLEAPGNKQLDLAKQTEWFNSSKFGVTDKANDDPVGQAGKVRTVRTLADNIIALIISPRLAENDTDESGGNVLDSSFQKPTDIAKNYYYNSRAWQESGGDADVKAYSKHQIPPVLRVTIVAIDEVDAYRYAMQNPDVKQIPKYAPSEPTWFTDVSQYARDMQRLKEGLEAVGIRYRVFTSNIRMREGNFQRL